MLDKICRIEYTVAKNKGAQIPEKWSLAPVFVISAKCEINIWQAKSDIIRITGRNFNF